MVEPAEFRKTAVERPLASVAERRMAEVMAERGSLREVFVERQRARQRTRNLRDLERMGKPGPEVIALVVDEHLGLVRQPPEGGRMNDAVAITPEVTAGGAGRLGDQPATAARRIFRKHRRLTALLDHRG